VKKKLIICIFFLSLFSINAQQQYLSTDDIKEEWNDYTSFQRVELINHSNFLFNEGRYERALLGYFQFLYKYPDDHLQLPAYYKIAKCYEKLKSWDLAKNYYNKIIDLSPNESIGVNSSKYQLLYILLLNNNYDKIIEKTVNSEDPYEIIFRAYAQFENLDFKNALLSFKTAEASFDHNYYSRLINPWYKAIQAAENAPLKEKTIALVSSIFPGGGFIYLKQNENAIGSILTSSLIFFALAKSNSITQKGKISLSNSYQQLIPLSNDLVHNKYSFKVSNEYDIPDKVILKEKINGATIPPIFFAGLLYFGSMWKTVIDIDNSNRKLVKRFSNRVTSKLPVENFMDYQTPDFILK